MINVCYSGGATGADTLFGQCAKAAGHKVVHFHFRASKQGLENHFILSDEMLAMANPFLEKANKKLLRKFPTAKKDVDGLLQRNYYQIADSDALYAVSSIVNGMVQGGTAWAVQMFIDKYGGHYSSCFVFDQITEAWYQWTALGFRPVKGTLKISGGKYAGIGSRELTPAGEQAIRNLYV